MRPNHLFVLMGLVAAFACATTKVYTPRDNATGSELLGLPASVVTVEVNDLRSDRSDSDALVAVLRQQVERALTRKAPPEGVAPHKLVIDVVEHRAYFTTGNWNAATRFRARLIGADGSMRGQWDASGSGKRSNMWGYSTAKAVSQDSYDAAIADLMSALNAASVRMP